MARRRTVRTGMGAGQGKGYKNMIGKDPVVHSMSAKGMKQPQMTNIDRFAEANMDKNPFLPEFVNEQVLTEQQINLLKRRLNDGKIKPDEIFMNNIIFRLTSEQFQKGRDFLVNQWKTPSGVERKNNPFGAREEYVVENLESFDLVDFYDNVNSVQANMGIRNYQPVYRAMASDGSYFEYWVGYKDRNQISPVNLIG